MTVYVDTAGSWETEVSWTVTDSAGSTLASGSADNIQHQICPVDCTTASDGTMCDDGNVQTANDICDSGTCVGCPVNDCVAVAGTFDTVTQQCSAPTSKANGTTCNDGDATTTNGVCFSGTCQGCPVPTGDCVAAAGTFDPLTQQCTAPTAAADGTTSASETTDNFGAALC